MVDDWMERVPNERMPPPLADLPLAEFPEMVEEWMEWEKGVPLMELYLE